MTFKKIITKIHLWLGLLSGLVVFVIGMTGCCLAFEEEIKSIVYAHRLNVEFQDGMKPLPLSQTFEIAQNALGKEIPIKEMFLGNGNDNSYAFGRYQHRNSDGIWYWDKITYYKFVYINPYSGEILGFNDERLEAFYVITMLHVSLLLELEIGTTIVAWSTVLFIILLISGLILWWPRNKKELKVNTWFRWKSTTRWKRKNYDLHNIVGFYIMFLALIIALTGLIWSFKWVNNSIQWLANGGALEKKERIIYQSDTTIVGSQNVLDIIYKQMRAQLPEARMYNIFLPSDSLGTIRARANSYDRTKNLHLRFDQYTGDMIAVDRWEDKTNGEKVRDYNFDIHTGAVGGIVGKTIAFFVSLFSASLPVTGFLIWWGRRRKKRKKPHSQTTAHSAGKHSHQPKPMRVRPKIKTPSSTD